MASVAAAHRLLERVVCPHCWTTFPPEEILWVSEHVDLMGDPRLGPEEPQRFLPTRFTAGGEAIDARGFPCHQLACPHCHLPIPRTSIEMESVFLSIFGAPASGKSYYLAAMSWQLRNVLPLQFGIRFGDADPLMNRQLNEYEEALFANTLGNKLTPLASLIRKTEEQGDLYSSVNYGNQVVQYSRPFLFTMQPEKSPEQGKTLCLYDNAGESFQPGKDTAASPVTRHLAQSRALFFVFDPTQDPRFRKLYGAEQIGQERLARQEPILHEAISRIRRHAGLGHNEKHNRPLIVILTKLDAWWRLLDDRQEEPFQQARRTRPDGESEKVWGLDTDVIEERSQAARELLLRSTPEIVTAAEGFARDVFYIPVSAVGWNAKLDVKTGLMAIRPEETRPHWAAVPLLYALSRWSKGLIPRISRQKTRSRA